MASTSSAREGARAPIDSAGDTYARPDRVRVGLAVATVVLACLAAA